LVSVAMLRVCEILVSVAMLCEILVSVAMLCEIFRMWVSVFCVNLSHPILSLTHARWRHCFSEI
jgi:hypothetical protein